ncbi:APC family permease [Blastococcus tunisiensis]|uniref:Amino acid transporter n=1 Tax=Blastococcus tunisiensis TaxID=1798228 RepID=A0A1I2BD17_9ACTN|nr:APC family permease [Blastococcus sp. DSM 46838]SFE54051.1 Amino acid transporter [Blastococcus sp. DSM 46838]
MAISDRPTTGTPPAVPVSPRTPEPVVRGLSGSLGVGAIVLMVVAAAAPLTVVAGSVPIGIAVGNGAGYPAAYIVSAVILALFAVGFVAMTPHVPQAGAFFSYVQRGLGRGAGLGAALVALITYVTIQGAVFGYIGAAIGDYLDQFGVPEVPWWLWTAGVIAVIGVLGYRHIELSSKVLGFALVAEIAVVVLLDLAIIARGGGPEGFSTAVFTPSEVFSGAPALGLMFAIAGFIGFEATAVFRDEARDPERTIPRATYVSLAVIGTFYAVSSWALISAWGDEAAVEVAGADPAGMVVTTTADYVGGIAGDVLNVLLITSLFACALSFHNVLSRYYFTLGNTGVLHRGLGSAHARHASPSSASLTQTVVSVVLMAVCVVAGLDPVLEIFTWLAGVATVGIVALMLLTCAAVLVFFRRTRVDTRPWQTLIAPALGLLGLAAILVVLVQNLALLMGGSTALGVGVVVLLAAALAGGPVLARLRPDAALPVPE